MWAGSAYARRRLCSSTSTAATGSRARSSSSTNRTSRPSAPGWCSARRRRERLTGVDDPYEAPEHPELVLATAELSPTGAAAAILEALETRGVVARSAPTEE